MKSGSRSFPTDMQVLKIQEWPLKSGWHDLMEFCESIWWDPGRAFYYSVTRYYLSTMEHPGNEAIIQAMRKNEKFWEMCWESSSRGGHHVFMRKKKS